MDGRELSECATLEDLQDWIQHYQFLEQEILDLKRRLAVLERRETETEREVDTLALARRKDQNGG